jgi:multidrug efflux system outer membrane protein
MIDMTRQALLRYLFGSVALGLAAGCASVRREEPAAGTNTAVAAEAVLPCPAPPAEGYTWDELARLASANCSEAKALLLEADAERYQTAVDTGWRNPQLRSGGHWGTEDEHAAGQTGEREWGSKDFDGYGAGVRVYTANPFVNRWLRKRGAASARAKEAESKETAYAVFCEVRALCLESEMLREETGLLEQMSVLRGKACDIRREQAEAVVISALELIRAETRVAALNAEIRETQTAQRQLIRRIATLAGIPAEQVRLRPDELKQQVDAACLDEGVLTELAFLRRPDLARAQLEKTSAEYAAGAARAAQIPWFEYVEGTCEDESVSTYSSEQNEVGRDRSESDETEWQVRVAVTLPVFNWLGDEIRLTRAQLAAAAMREQGLYGSIRREVGGVLEDYRSVRAEYDRVAAERERLRSTLSTRIDVLESEATVPREDVLEARQEWIGYLRVCMKVERECMRLAQVLETVSGGSLTVKP